MGMKATWNGMTLAEGETVKVEGNHYFDNDDINWDLLEESPTTSRCYWKGKASYYHVVADGDVNADAAFTYEKPWPLAKKITNHTAFWRGVKISG